MPRMKNLFSLKQLPSNCLEEPEDFFGEAQGGAWEGKETAAKEQRPGMESVQTGL